MLYDVVGLGELLIDFTPYGVSDQGNRVLEVNPGGGICNMLSMVSKLGGKTAFIGKVGDDSFGHLLVDVIKKQGINADNTVIDKRYATTLAFVHLDDFGERSFSFCRKPGADMMLEKDEIDINLLKNCTIFHFGSLPLTNEPSRCATRFAISEAKKAGALIAFDPNIRPLLWDSMETAKEQLLYGIGNCDILKLSEEELELATGESNIEKGTELVLKENSNVKIIFITLGKEGSFYRYKDFSGTMPAFTNLKTIDTTGAGDTFMGCCLYTIAKKGLQNLDKSSLDELLRFANAAASLITTKKGALKVMPDIDEINKLLTGC